MFQILTILLCFQLYFVSCNDDLYSKFQQHDYKIDFTRGELVQYNKDVFKKFEVVTFKYNRTLAVANVTFQLKVQLNNTNNDVVIQCYKFLSNEYRIISIRFRLNVCRAFEANLSGSLDILRRCGNTRNCQFGKSVTYHVCNIHPDQSRFPPFIPNGEYKIEQTLINGNLTLAVLNTYAKAYRPIKIK